jgi:MFS family permease
LSSGLFSFYNICQFALFNVIVSDLISSFHLTLTQVSFFASVFIITNTLWIFPGSILVKIYTARRTALIFMLLNIGATLVLAKSQWLFLSIIMRIIQGMASAISLLIYVRIVPAWFPKTPATAIGIIGSIASLGGVFANAIFVNWVVWWGWRTALEIDAIVGLLFFVIMYFFLYENYNQQPPVSYCQKFTFNNIKVVLSNIHNTLCGLYIGLMTLPVFLLASL